MRCESHTLNLVATSDPGKTLNKCAIYKKYYCSAFAKTQETCVKRRGYQFVKPRGYRFVGLGGHQFVGFPSRSKQ